MDFFDFFFLTHDTQKTIPITVRGGKNIYIYIKWKFFKIEPTNVTHSRENKFKWKFQFRRVTTDS